MKHIIQVKTTWFFLCFAFFSLWSSAQEITIRGTVTDETGPLPGANVIVKGTTTGTVTDFDGNYEITANPDDVLVFSAMGFVTREVRVGNQQTIDVSMQTDMQSLEEVVVTAMGISREKKSLGYATQEVSGEDVNQARQGNVTNALSGKVAGLQIRRNTTLGGSTNVIIRGNTSLTGNNQAL